MKKVILLILLSTICFTGALSAATAKINKVWIEHGVTINNRSAMKVHCNFDVTGMKNLKGDMCIWIKGPSGKWHKVNSPHRSTTGTSYFKWSYQPSVNTAHYSDFWYAPYVDDLQLLSGKNTYKVVVTISDNKGNNLAQSNEIEFTGTGNNNGNNRNNALSPDNKPKSGNRNNIVDRSRKPLSFGGFAIVEKYANGFKTETNYGKCISCQGTASCGLCHGTRTCNICYGRGGIVSAGYGTFYPCASCSGTGRCSVCNGSGQCVCSNSAYPGYAAIGTLYYDSNGKPINYSSFRVNTLDDSDNKNTNRNKSKSTCPDCGGTRLWRRGAEPEYGRPRSDLVGVYNARGERCQHCGKYTEHWHSKCTTCIYISGTDNPYR
ncbi:MAG: hypothetical protein NC338_00570 [Firmicutes bacterium]|nr:hypothetical protein [Bacillota bacterium]MCM1400613.1 hypothetical protein [Bacteroides sp.]MCM1477885.1 hypothetical protein [Bacteroides sp.]